VATDRDPEEPAIVITNSRKVTAEGEVRQPKFPSAQELLVSTTDGLSEQDKEDLLRKQAAEYEGVPYEGAGIEAPVDVEIPNHRTAFLVVISQDGVPSIIRAEVPSRFEDDPDNEGERIELGPAFTYDRDPVNRDIWLACTEIAGDINRAETAMVTANALAQQAAAGMMRQQAQMAQAMQARGGKGRRN
jgi:hypothetical protein